VERGKLQVNIGREDQKRGKLDLGGVWMMVSIQASVSGSNPSIFANLCLLCLCCHKSPKGGDCSEHDPIQRGRMWDQSKLSNSKVGRGKLRVNIGREDQKRGEA
jgi:hypothetical protein